MDASWEFGISINLHIFHCDGPCVVRREGERDQCMMAWVCQHIAVKSYLLEYGTPGIPNHVCVVGN
jgi:hypothetical protein